MASNRRRMSGLDRQSAFSGTRRAASHLAFDAERLQTYLSASVAGFAGPVTIRQFKGGQSNPTYLIETPALELAWSEIVDVPLTTLVATNAMQVH